MFSIFQNVNITTCPDQLTVQGLSTSSVPSIHTNTSWVLGCIDANGTVCMPQMNVNTVVSRSSPNVEFIRWMVDTYSVGSWFWWAFLGAIGFKLFVLLLVTRQFYYVPKEDRGTLLCCCGCCQSTKTGKSLSRHGSQLRALVNSDQRRRRMLQLDEDMKNWTSVLRSRDIQLLLRLSRNMPKLSHLVQFSQADADVVDIGKRRRMPHVLEPSVWPSNISFEHRIHLHCFIIFCFFHDALQPNVCWEQGGSLTLP